MAGSLFDGEGLEFHHLQRAQLSRNQLQTNQLLRQQNELLRRAEQQRAQEQLPQCPHCKTRFSYENIKPSRCPDCVAPLFWADNVLHPFATRAQLEEHKGRLRSGTASRELPSKIEKRITELRQACSWLTAGRLSKSQQGQLLQYLQSTVAVVSAVLQLQRDEPNGPVPGRYSTLRELIRELATSAESQAVAGYSPVHRQYAVRLLTDCGYQLPDQHAPPASTSSECSSPATSHEATIANKAAATSFSAGEDPSGICQWFASEALTVLACVAVADQKLRASEVSVISETAKALGTPLGEQALRDLIVERCKEVSRLGAVAVLRELCHRLRVLQGFRPARFLIRCAESVAMSEGTVGPSERELLSVLEESLGDPSSGLSISDDLI